MAQASESFTLKPTRLRVVLVLSEFHTETGAAQLRCQIAKPDYLAGNAVDQRFRLMLFRQHVPRIRFNFEMVCLRLISSNYLQTRFDFNLRRTNQIELRCKNWDMEMDSPSPNWRGPEMGQCQWQILEELNFAI